MLNCQAQSVSNLSMELDVASTTSTSQLGGLKRYNSEPYINATDPNTSSSSPSLTTDTSHCSSTSFGNSFNSHLTDKVRRSSTNSMALHSPTARTPSRLDQIRQEESIAQSDREVAHEREVQSSMIMTHSWDELSLDDAEAMLTDSKLRPKSFTEPLHVYTSTYPYASSPSPTRAAVKQCFSPLLQQPIRTSVSPNPSPTRRTYVRRSLSPIVLRPSPLSAVKRKIEIESELTSQNYFSSPKRFRTNSSSGASTPDRSLYNPLVLSVPTTSSSDMDVTPNSDEQGGGSDSASTSKQAPPTRSLSPGQFSFQLMRETHTSDSESSEGSDDGLTNEHAGRPFSLMTTTPPSAKTRPSQPSVVPDTDEYEPS